VVEPYAALAEEAWRWVLAQVRWDDGPWVPRSVPWPGDAGPPADRDSVHSGVGGLALALVLAEVRRRRGWTGEEAELAAAIGDRLRRALPTKTDATWFDGLPGDVGVFLALDTEGVAGAREVAGHAAGVLMAEAEPTERRGRCCRPESGGCRGRPESRRT